MSTLEDRLREALAERAAHSPIGPDAWDKTVARAGRRQIRPGVPRRLPSGLLFPAGAAVAVIAVILAAVALTSGHPTASLDSPPGGASTSLPPGATGLMRSDPPFTGVVPVTDKPATLYFWYSNPENPALCYFAASGQFGSIGNCLPVRAASAGQSAFLVASLGPINLGAVTSWATSIVVRLNGSGRAIPGRLVFGPGFPEKVWLANYPPGDSGTILFRDFAGLHAASIHVVPVHLLPAPARPRHGGITVHGWTAYLIDRRVIWWRPAKGARETQLPWTVAQMPLMVFLQSAGSANYAVGWTPAEVTRVELRLPDGRTYADPTVPGWPGSGVRLWVRPLPRGTIPDKTLVIGYNSAGQILAEQTLQSLYNGVP